MVCCHAQYWVQISVLGLRECIIERVDMQKRICWTFRAEVGLDDGTPVEMVRGAKDVGERQYPLASRMMIPSITITLGYLVGCVLGEFKSLRWAK